MISEVHSTSGQCQRRQTLARAWLHRPRRMRWEAHVCVITKQLALLHAKSTVCTKFWSQSSGVAWSSTHDRGTDMHVEIALFATMHLDSHTRVVLQRAVGPLGCSQRLCANSVLGRGYKRVCSSGMSTQWFAQRPTTAAPCLFRVQGCTKLVPTAVFTFGSLRFDPRASLVGDHGVAR